MKIVFVGKGGSGKSSLSWLAAEQSAAAGHTTLLIDADHNMEMAHHYLGTAVREAPTLHRLHDNFRQLVGLTADRQWHTIVLDGRTLPSFSLTPKDTFTAKATIKIKENLHLSIVGLGADDIITSSRCAHGHSAVLKYYLPLLSLTSNEMVIVDGVAGVDMLNFGLFAGADAIVVAINHHHSSVRVAADIRTISEKVGLPIFAVSNKTTPETTFPYTEWEDILVGSITLDGGITTYNYAAVQQENKIAMKNILAEVQQRCPNVSPLQRLARQEKLRHNLA